MPTELNDSVCVGNRRGNLAASFVTVQGFIVKPPGLDRIATLLRDLMPRAAVDSLGVNFSCGFERPLYGCISFCYVIGLTR